MWPARDLLAKRMRQEVSKKAREDHYPAPYRLIDLFERYGGNDEAMKAAETRAFAPLMVSDQSRNLRRVFWLSELLKGQAPKKLGWRPSRVHVIGAGTMGADIAGWCVACGMEVTLQDVSAEQIAKGIAAQGKLFARKFKTKALRDAAKARLIADPNGEGIPHADVVIEAIVENLEIKQKVLGEVETKMKPGAVLATNTSSLLIEDIAAGLPDPGRLIGLHFFNPVAQMPLVEVVRGAAVARGRREARRRLRRRHRQVPAHHQERAGLPRQPRADALHVRRHAAPGARRGQGADRRGGARLRHADGADRARRYRRPRCVRARRPHPQVLLGRLQARPAGRRAASSARSRARASTCGRTASRRRPAAPSTRRRWTSSAASWSSR